MSEYINNILYGVHSFVNGLKVTWDHFINKKELVATLQYPHEKWPIPERNIGFNHSEYNLIRSRLHVDIDDCIACMQCERACPVDCIKIDSIKPPKDNDFDCGLTSNDTQKKMIVSRFTIDMSECMYCNLCVYPCPEECIYMVGGPNDKKHEIDYEFSQYKRDGMIFEFADATDEMIRNAGGDKWLEKRDERHNVVKKGIELAGDIKATTQIPPETQNKTHDVVISTEQKASGKSTGELEIQSFNEIADKMCRGIAKKAFMAAKRSEKDHVEILASVAQALGDAGKMTDDIQEVLNSLSQKEESVRSEIKPAPSNESTSSEVTEMDIKDLNSIEDKMTRGTAKKAFTVAKRTGINRVEAVRQALEKANLMDEIIAKLLNSFSSNSATPNKEESLLPLEETEAADDASYLDDLSVLPLFEITDLNGIEDKMARGIAKKTYTAGKRADKSRMEVIADIRIALDEAGKMDDSSETVLSTLEAQT